MLNEIEKLHDESSKAPKLEDRLEALHRMGEQHLILAELDDQGSPEAETAAAYLAQAGAK